MKRGTLKNTLALALLAAACGLSIWLPNQPRPPQPLPRNILLITIDTQRADHLGAYGYSRDTSPNLDRLAAKAAVFNQAYSHCPWTLPSVASILTSLPPRDHGIYNWRQPLPLERLTLAEHFLAQGYHTEAYVSHTILREQYQYDQGFLEYNDEVLHKGHPHKVSTSSELTDLFLASMAEGLPEPFFVWLHYFDPHFHYINRSEYGFGKAPVDRYDSEIRYNDEQIGRVFDELSRRALWRNTVVVVTADHGEEFGERGGRYHTKTLYDEVLRVPLMIRVPGAVAQRLDAVVATTDIGPTLCDLVGVPVPRVFGGLTLPFNGQRFQVARGHAVVAETLHQADKRGLRVDQWKYIQDRAKNETSLFDLEADPGEEHNLVTERPEVAARLQKALDRHYGVERSTADEQALTEELREQLEALGYL